MYCITVVYPRTDGASFDFDYYLASHMPLVERRFGENLVRYEVRKGVASPDGSPASFVCVANCWIHSVERFKATLEEHGSEIMGDIPNYTAIEPTIQIDEVVG